jgi:endonuclease YncB( thermonuclease family)
MIDMNGEMKKLVDRNHAERCASEATHRLHQLAGDSVRLEDGPRLTDQFGRTLAYSYSTEGGVSIDETLIRKGLATAWTRDGQH